LRVGDNPPGTQKDTGARQDGKTLAEWLCDTLLREAGQCPADPVELALTRKPDIATNRLVNFDSVET